MHSSFYQMSPTTSSEMFNRCSIIVVNFYFIIISIQSANIHFNIIIFLMTFTFSVTLKKVHYVDMDFNSTYRL